MLALALDETQVQEWLLEQLNLRAAGRYHAFREAEVAGEKKPDIVIASTQGRSQVAIEVKHGGMKWSPRDLDNALSRQLSGQYLLPR